MKILTEQDIPKLILPAKNSHKGQNGRLLVIGGSHFFHAASLWALTVSSRIVDLVHYASVPENETLVQKAKEEFRNGIVVPREEIERYIEEDDCILIGPGMMRPEHNIPALDSLDETSFKDILTIKDEGIQTWYLTNYLVKKYPQKQWIIDAGALQMINVSLIPKQAILTPHKREFEDLVTKVKIANPTLFPSEDIPLKDTISLLVKKLGCILLVKGEIDIACTGGTCDEYLCTPGECVEIHGGNAGMTKGGTGDVLAGLIAGLSCLQDPFTATCVGSFINKQAGDDLFEQVGFFYNASDLADQIPKTMKRLVMDK